MIPAIGNQIATWKWRLLTIDQNPEARKYIWEAEQLVEYKLKKLITKDANLMEELNIDAQSTVGFMMRKI